MDIHVQIFLRDGSEFLWDYSCHLVPRVGDEICIDELPDTDGRDLPSYVVVTSVTWHIDGSNMVHITCEDTREAVK